MRAAALIFDLDETLVADKLATWRSLAAAARRELTSPESAESALDVADSARMAEALTDAVWQAADALWSASPHARYAEAIGMASWEALWARFDGEQPEVRALRAWAPDYRRQTWREALAARELRADDACADRLQAAFLDERRALHILFPDALPALQRLRQRYRLALLTNGDSGLQREKVAGARLGDYFEVMVASGDIGVGKPDPRIYTYTLAQLGVAPGAALMIGDNPINDVAGAQAVGMRGIWLDRERTLTAPPARRHARRRDRLARRVAASACRGRLAEQSPYLDALIPPGKRIKRGRAVGVRRRRTWSTC